MHAGDATFAQADAFSEALQEAVVQSISTAFAAAIAGWDDCGTIAETDACIGCKARDEVCAGSTVGDVVLGCCDPNDVCLERNSRRSYCKAADYQPSRFWTGTIHTCNENDQTAGPPLL